MFVSIHKAAAQYVTGFIISPWSSIQSENKWILLDSSLFWREMNDPSWQFLFFAPQLFAQTIDNRYGPDLHGGLVTALNP